MRFLNRGQKLNAYNVIPVLFYTDCNHTSVHGTVRVSNRKLRLENVVVDFFLKNHAKAPAFTPKLFAEIEAAAESQGYVLHELVSYVSIKTPDWLQADEPAASQDVPAPHGHTYSRELRVGRSDRPTVTEEGVWTGTGTIHHAESPAEMGERVIRNMSHVPPQAPREPFDMHSLSDLSVPAFLRKQAGADLKEPIPAAKEATVE
jgi:hypothetical protein